MGWRLLTAVRWGEERGPGRAPVVGDVRVVAGKEDRGLGFSSFLSWQGECEERMDLTEKREAVRNIGWLRGDRVEGFEGVGSGRDGD